MFIDIVIVIIFLFLLLEGYIQGLMRSLIGLFGYVFSIVMAFMYYLPMAEYLKKHFEWFRMLKPRISDGLVSGIEHQIQAGVNEMANSASAEVTNMAGNQLSNTANQEMLNEMIDKSGVMNSFMDSINHFSGASNSAQAGVGVMKSSADAIADGIVNGIGFLVVLIGCIMAVKLIGMILDIATEAPIIKQVNKFGGMLFGVAKAALLVFVLMMLAMYIGPLFPDLKLVSMIYESKIGVYFYEHNLLLIAINMFMK